MSNFYEYDQNNSGGNFGPPAIKVFIEANSVVEAYEIAQDKYGIYFDGVDNGMDCDCCGDRWRIAYHPIDIHKELTELCTYFRKLEHLNQYNVWSKESGCYLIVLHNDGHEEKLSVEDIYNYLPQGGSNV